MLITCHNCETIFQIDKSKIAQKGQQVKCSVCAHVWTIFPDNEEEANTPKLNLDRNEELSTEAKTQKLQGPKHRQDILEKNKKSNFLAFLICNDAHPNIAISLESHNFPLTHTHTHSNKATFALEGFSQS